MKKVCIIYTGGTIGMTKTEKGYAPCPGFLEKKLGEMEDLHSDRLPKWDLVEMSPLLDSSNITVKEWNDIAGEIERRYYDYSGFVILHGTDTMAYTSSALSFMLENLAKPVVFTGSQIPLCEIRSDARDNLITSLMIAAEGRVREVCLYFGGKLMRGNRATKYSADGLEAFRSPNFPNIAEAGIEIKYSEELLRTTDAGLLHVRKLAPVPIGVIKIFPGIQFDLFEPIMTERLKGLVIETFGAGNIPDGEDAMLPMIKKAAANGTVITVCTQCPKGTVSLGAYKTSSILKEAGAVCGFDLTTEAAVAKLYYLFNCGLESETVKYLMEQNLCGELSL